MFKSSFGAFHLPKKDKEEKVPFQPSKLSFQRWKYKKSSGHLFEAFYKSQGIKNLVERFKSSLKKAEEFDNQSIYTKVYKKINVKM